MKFPAINLWSIPRQKRDWIRKSIDASRKDISDLEIDIKVSEEYIRFDKCILEEAQEELSDSRQQLKDLEFIYYIRSGRFPE